MPFKNFVHLHVHTEYSLLDGACRLDALIQRARDLRMPALAITDHGALYGAVEFYTGCLKHGIKPIIGMEAYVAAGSRLDKQNAHGMKDAGNHLVLLARDFAGYRNLVALSSIGFLQGFYYRPRLDKDVLSRHAGGLIALSACLHGEIPMLLQKEEYPLARQTADDYRQIFGPGNFYLEIMDHGLPAQAQVNRGLVDLARDLQLPLVATNDVHYLRPQDALAQEALLAMQTGTHLADEGRLRMPSQEFYLKSGAEMAALFPEHPEAGFNTAEIANRCNLELPSGRIQLPHYPVPESLRPQLAPLVQAGLGELDAYLQHLCLEGLSQRYPDPGPAVRERLERELKVIREMGYAAYFLIVWDFIRYARGQKIPVGPGRGSVAGSLVAYVLEITQIDPLRYGLIFERFLNPERISLPDIDVDFSDRGREAVIDYVTRRYGRENVAQIITFGTLAARAAVRDVGRVLNYGYDEVDRLAKMIPQTLDITLAKAMDQVPDLKQRYTQDERIRRLLDTAQALEGQVRHASTHAAGVVISRDPLLDLVPLCHTKTARSGEGGGTASEATLTTQYPMESLERLGLLKMDFLGLRTLSLMADTVAAVAKSSGRVIDLDDIPLHDTPTFDLLQSAQTLGVFQLESPGMRDLLRRLKPGSLEEICALIALFRPGPMGIIDEYIQRKQGKVPIRYAHPALEPILKETYGTIVYQEQVMEIAVQLGGFTFGEADLLRRAMSKKNPEAIERQRERFAAGCRRLGLSGDAAERVFDYMARFGEYGFNKSHSLAYAWLAYQTAYLKAHFPLEYAAATLSNEMNQVDKIGEHVQAYRRSGLTILPPDINASRENFSVETGSVRYGLSAIRHVGESAAAAIRQNREEHGPFASAADFCSRVDWHQVSGRAIESLVKAGAFDRLHPSRTALLNALPRLMASGQRWQEEKAQGQLSIFHHEAAGIPDDTVERQPDPEKIRLALEKEVIGFYLTGHPLEQHRELLKIYTTASSRGLKEVGEGGSVILGGEVTLVRPQVTKRQEPMMRFILEDMDGPVEVIVWPELLGRHKLFLVKDALLLVVGKVDRSGEEEKIVASDIIPFSQAFTQLSRRVHLRLPPGGWDEDRLTDLKQQLGTHAGPTPVWLHVSLQRDGAEAVQELPERFNVTVSTDLLDTLRQRFGVDRVWVEGLGQRN